MSHGRSELSPRSLLDDLVRAAIYIAPGLVLLVALSRDRNNRDASPPRAPGPVSIKDQSPAEFDPATLEFTAWDYYDR
jgi:hypothetical protein